MTKKTLLRNNNFNVSKIFSLHDDVECDVVTLTPTGAIKSRENGSIVIFPKIERLNTFIVFHYNRESRSGTVSVYEKSTGVSLCVVERKGDWVSKVSNIILDFIRMFGGIEKYEKEILMLDSAINRGRGIDFQT